MGLDNNYENPTRYAWHHGRIFEYSDIFPLVECEFEGMTSYAPANYDKYVFAEYGIRYVEMPNNYGAPAHTRYFKNICVTDAFAELREIIDDSDAEVSTELTEEE